jgi:hypothetical protein
MCFVSGSAKESGFALIAVSFAAAPLGVESVIHLFNGASRIGNCRKALLKQAGARNAEHSFSITVGVT